jgi:transcriptional regulator with XRE-family HTH domain
MTIGDKIQKTRNDKGITQEALAQLAGVPYTTLAKIESGQVKNPTINTLIKIAAALKITLDDLINLKQK